MQQPIYEGKSKRLFATGNPHELIMEFKDDATAFNAEKRAVFADKGRLNCAISNLIYGMLEKEGVPTHFIRSVDETRVVVKKVDILMVEVIVRNVAAGSFCKRTGVEEGMPFSRPVVEFSLKSDALGDPLINDDYIRELGLASEADLAFLRAVRLDGEPSAFGFLPEGGVEAGGFQTGIRPPGRRPGHDCPGG